jgi:hypothetical protein
MFAPGFVWFRHTTDLQAGRHRGGASCATVDGVLSLAPLPRTELPSEAINGSSIQPQIDKK